MKVSNTSIVKSESANTAITTAMAEWFNKDAIAKYSELLVVDGLVGVCISVENEDLYDCTHTSYFIVTELHAGLMRVEYCTEMKMDWHSLSGVKNEN